MSPEALLELRGFALPRPAAAIANYAPFVLAGKLLYVSGQLAFQPDGTLHARHIGKLGRDVSLDAGKEAARFCALNVLGQAKAALGELARIACCVRLGGFINCTPDYESVAAVMNGASDLIVEALGERGPHARSTIGVAQLPLDCAVEVEAIFQVE